MDTEETKKRSRENILEEHFNFRKAHKIEARRKKQEEQEARKKRIQDAQDRFDKFLDDIPSGKKGVFFDPEVRHLFYDTGLISEKNFIFDDVGLEISGIEVCKSLTKDETFEAFVKFLGGIEEGQEFVLWEIACQIRSTDNYVIQAFKDFIKNPEWKNYYTFKKGDSYENSTIGLKNFIRSKRVLHLEMDP